MWAEAYMVYFKGTLNYCLEGSTKTIKSSVIPQLRFKLAISRIWFWDSDVLWCIKCKGMWRWIRWENGLYNERKWTWSRHISKFSRKYLRGWGMSRRIGLPVPWPRLSTAFLLPPPWLIGFYTVLLLEKACWNSVKNEWFLSIFITYPLYSCLSLSLSYFCLISPVFLSHPFQFFTTKKHQHERHFSVFVTHIRSTYNSCLMAAALLKWNILPSSVYA